MRSNQNDEKAMDVLAESRNKLATRETCQAEFRTRKSTM